MRLFLLITITALLYAAQTTAIQAGGKCTGSSPCSACTNYTGCKHCKSGGICGTCKPVSIKTKTDTNKKQQDTLTKDSTNVQPK